MTARRGPSASATARPCSVLGDQLGRLLEVRDAVGEEDGVVGEQLELGRRRAEGGRVRRMGVDDRAHVGPPRVDLRVEDGLQVEGRRRVVDLDDVVRRDLVERDALALDVDGLAAGGPALTWPSVRSAEPLQREDAAGPRDLLAHRLRRGARSSPALGRRVVGVWEAEDHDHVLVARVRDGVPDAGRDVSASPSRERDRAVVEPELARCRRRRRRPPRSRGRRAAARCPA